MISHLKASGKSDEEIERYVPKTAEEQRQYALDRSNDMTRMKKDIAFLFNQVNDLREKIGNASTSGN